MALNFPDTPTIGQTFPSPAQAGIPVWKWDGSEWTQISTGGSAQLNTYEYTATAGQTTFSGADINSKVMSYTVNCIDVYLNGAHLNIEDYTATSGTSIVFATGLKLNDQVTIAAYSSFSLVQALQPANNLSDVPNDPVARANIGAIGAVHVQTFSASGTYTPNANLIFATIELVGGGGGGGGVVGSTTYYLAGGGGGAGGYARKYATAAAIGVSQAVTIGAAGSVSSGGAGGTGGTTSVGALCSATGGTGGTASTTATVGTGGTGGAMSAGDFGINGYPGMPGYYNSVGSTSNIEFVAGIGGSCVFGPGGTGGSGAGVHGGGGGGGWVAVAGSTVQGGGGGAGYVLITEYCSA